MKCYDAIVVGLGGMGSATIANLAARNARVLGIEQFTPAHSRGSSHGQSRIIRQSYFEHPNYVPLLIRAYELWRNLELETGLDLMTLTGGLMIGPPDCQTVQGSLASAVQHSLPHELLTAAQIRDRFPAFNPPLGTVGLYETNAGYLRPELCIQAHLSQATKSNAELHFGERVIDWQPSSSGKTAIVRTEHNTYETPSLVLSPGAWAPSLFRFELPLVVVRQVLFWIKPTSGTANFLPGRFPVYIWETLDGTQFYGFPQHGPESDGIKVAVFYNEEPCDPNRLSLTISPTLERQIRECLTTRIPSLTGAIVKTVPCMYTNTPDHHFILGKHPVYPSVTIASPCSGHGFKFCSVVGEILADLAMDGHTQHSIEMFSPVRESLQ